MPEEDYLFNKSAEYLGLQDNLQRTKKAGLANPFFYIHDGITGDRTTIAGREYINFCSYNYLGMSGDPTVTRAANADRSGRSSHPTPPSPARNRSSAAVASPVRTAAANAPMALSSANR